MTKRLSAILTAAVLALSFAGCSSSKTESPADDHTETTQEVTWTDDFTAEEMSDDTNTEESAVAHISPMEKITSNTGTQVSIGQIISRNHGENTIEFPLSDYIKAGDRIHSFTFVIFGEEGAINEFKGGCGISVTNDCPSATSENWYQSAEFKAPTEGAYGEITWNVPEDVAKYVNPGGTFKFGYYWGDCKNIRLDSVICQYSRSKNVPADGTVSKDIGTMVNFNDEDKFFRIPTDILPENTLPEVVTCRLDFGGNFGKFNGAFMYGSSLGSFNDNDVAVISDSNELELVWFVPKEVKNIYNSSGELKLGYWWSEQPDATLTSVEIKYSDVNTSSVVEDLVASDTAEDSVHFRTAQQIVSSINAGWNLGNTLDSYKTGSSGLDTETGWGNPRASKELIGTVKGAGFNTIRIPVTWGEHLKGNEINEDWLNRVQEVVDYAYDSGMFVILDMHHDDYIWLKPQESTYEKNSERLKAIWTQIANRFKDYDDRLLFEGMNEPRTTGSALEWMGGTPDERAVVNKYEADFVNAVRATGGNNKERSLIITSYAASAESNALNDVQIPDTDNIIMTVHYYAPWKFAEGKDPKFDKSGQEELAAKFNELQQKFIENGIPVLIDEFGCVNACSASTRADYYHYYVSSAKAHGIKCVVWDNGIISGDGSFGIVSRESYNWDTGVLNAIIDGAK